MKSLPIVLGLTAVFAVCATPSGLSGADRLLIPQEAPWPLYATGLGHTGSNTTDWVGTAFYYPPELIPGKYSLWDFPVLEPPVGTVTPNIEGFYVLSDPSTPGSPPRQAVLRNAPGARVPIWFTSVQNFLNGVHGIPPGTWTVKSLEAEDSIVGWADVYQETRELMDQSKPDGPMHILIIASGRLEDGRTFRLQSAVDAGFVPSGRTYDLKVEFEP